MVYPNLACIERNPGLFEHDFLRFVCGRFPNLSYKAKLTLLLLKDGWKYIFLLINWLETIQFCNNDYIVIITVVIALFSLCI